MLPSLSIAALGIQRDVASGENVPCWNTLGVAFGLRTSYQRTPSTSVFLLPLTFTLWLTTSVSVPPRLRYASRYISRSPRESSFSRVPGCGTQAPPPHAGENAATAIVVGPVNVAFAGAAKSTWNFHSRSELVPKFSRWLGEPAGGGEATPSRSAGNRLANDVDSWKHSCVAGAPLIIFARSNAQTRAPWNVDVKMLNVT